MERSAKVAEPQNVGGKLTSKRVSSCRTTGVRTVSGVSRVIAVRIFYPIAIVGNVGVIILDYRRQSGVEQA